jgi:hypothetical protein
MSRAPEECQVCGEDKMQHHGQVVEHEGLLFMEGHIFRNDSLIVSSGMSALQNWKNRES